jgi:hypothetical protein
VVWCGVVLQVQPKTPEQLSVSLERVAAGTSTMNSAVGPAVGCLMATFGTSLITDCIFDFDDPEQLQTVGMEQRLELWGLQVCCKDVQRMMCCVRGPPAAGPCLIDLGQRSLVGKGYSSVGSQNGIDQTSALFVLVLQIPHTSVRPALTAEPGGCSSSCASPEPGKRGTASEASTATYCMHACCDSTTVLPA